MALSAAGFDALPAAQRAVLAALALGAVPRPRTWAYQALENPVLRSGVERRYTQEQVRDSLHTLAEAGWVVQDLRRTGYWSPQTDALPVVWSYLRTLQVERLRDTLATSDGYPAYGGGRFAGVNRLPSVDAAVALVRLDALFGSSIEQLERLRNRLPWGCESVEALLTPALASLLREPVVGWLDVSVATHMLLVEVSAWLQTSVLPTGLKLEEAVTRAVKADPYPFEHTHTLRWVWAEVLCTMGRADEVEAYLAPLLQRPDGAPSDGNWPGRSALREGFRSVQHMQAGRWRDAVMCFEEAHAVLRKVTGRRNSVMPPVVGLAYALALLALGSPGDLQKALKFCLAEGGRREPMLDTPFGFIALAIQMRQGDARRELSVFQPYMMGGQAQISPLDLWRWLMRAWLKEGALPESLTPVEQEAAQRLLERFNQGGAREQSRLLRAALAVLQGETTPPDFFIQGVRERWQQTLESLRALVATTPSSGIEAKEAATTRLVWVLELDPRGGLVDLQALEQKQGARGWGKPKEVPLSRLQRQAESLPPQDAAVARAVRQDGAGRSFRVDLGEAVSALVGHPHVALEPFHDQFIELTEGQPALDVVRENGKLRVRLWPPMALSSDEAQMRWFSSAAAQKEWEAARLCCVVVDSPQRARLVRLTPAQKRVAQLLGSEGLVTPIEAAPQLQEVLTGLGTHFRIQSDEESASAQAARDVLADARLRAELSPQGEGLSLRLVAAPFGPDHAAQGPRLIPGHGRARLVVALGGEMLGVQRDLSLERAHLDTVLQACPMLEPLAEAAPCEWLVEDPEQALTLVERLRPLQALQSLDWPQGKSVRVDSVGLNQLTLRVHTRQEWLALEGDLQVDEELVLNLQQLIALQAQHAASRFVPLGDGRYVALTQELKERLAEMARVAEQRAGGKDTLAALRVPTVAAPWLQQVAKGTQFIMDEAMARQLARLEEAQAWVPALPTTLQARLRPYQEEGFEWAMRLSYAGLGACLADDMGLGKTLQALAVLLARAAKGPALIVAPTSLVGNWRAEARRFAPSLDVHIYGEPGADREAQRALNGAGQVLIVSYALLQPEAEAFQARSWATLILDEAQAIKNAAAKRSQAVFGLEAGFRLALSGTPIENRLAELWSVMRACNPGLLGSLSRFNERFAGPIERQRDKAAQRQLRRLIAPFILRRTKAQVLDDLPPRTELVLQVHSEAAEQAHYEALRRDALVAAERSLSGDAPGQAQLNILAGLTRLRRAACDPRLASPHLQLVGAKVQAFGELATELVANGHKTLVFSQFVDFLQLLKAPLDEAGITYQYLDGSTPAAERMKRVDAFQAGQGDLFLISLKAGGFGLNLTVADFVVIADPWWNPAAEDQASGRAHRIGQQRPVTVYRLVNEGTLEEKILTLHRDKRELADLLLEDDGQERKTLPRAEELMALMRGDSDAAS